MFGLGGGLFTFAALFYVAASYEHLSGWKWALASAAVTFTVNRLFPASFIFVLPAQFGLFLLMWWAHTKNKVQREVERAKQPARVRTGTQKSASARRPLPRRSKTGKNGFGWPAKPVSAKRANGA